jgi:hypothetical protein
MREKLGIVLAVRSPLQHGDTVSQSSTILSFPTYLHARTSPFPPQRLLLTQPPLDNFIAYALHRTRLHAFPTFAAPYLLQRLKAHFPKESSGDGLFISAFMLASKIVCDDTYFNKSWCIVSQGMFALREVLSQ